jgi:hypothetical protein
MKPKTTLNLFNDYFTNSTQKIILLFGVFLDKKTFLTPYKIAIVSVFIFFSANSYSQPCKATLQVEKNRFTKSVPPEGTSYSLQISNTGSKSTTYVLSETNINSSCSNNDGSSSSKNVNLNISFTDTNSNIINQITLNPSETVTFLVKIRIPMGTAVNKWNCTQITATSIECPTYKVNTVLHTLVSDPSAE